MHKFWKLKESKFNKLILIKDKTIYKGNPKETDLNRLSSETSDFTFSKDLFSIPYSYIRKVENQSGKNYIKIYFGNNSEEELYIENQNIKNEIFEVLKTENPNLNYTSKIPSVIKYAKAQLFALLFSTGIFIWSLYLAIQIESGVNYELVGGGRPGITGFILLIANLGTLNVILGYLIILGITIVALKKRLKSRSETEFLKR
jgi:ATP-dependent Zn protease